MGYIRHKSENVILKVAVLEAGKMGKRKDLSDFDKCQIVMLDDCVISKTAALVECYRSAVVSPKSSPRKEKR